MLSRLLIALALCWSLAGPVFAQSNESFDAAEFAVIADRARQVVDNGQASDSALTDLRTTLAAWREAALAARERRIVRVDTIKSQLDALGPAPDEGVVEPIETSARRTELNAQLREAQAPLLEAQSAFERANGLISEIDRLFRSRLSAALLTRGPSPLFPPNWVTAGESIAEVKSSISREVQTVTRAPASRQLVLDRLPLVGLLLLVSFALIWPWRRLRFWQAHTGQSLAERPNGWVMLTRSILALSLPVLGISLAVFALRRLGVFGLTGNAILSALPLAGLSITGSIWLGWIMRLELPSDRVNDPDPRRLQRLATFIGSAIALSLILDNVTAIRELDAATISVLRFPVILILSAGVAGIWFLTKSRRWIDRTLFPQEGAIAKTVPYIRFAIAAVAIGAPLLAAVGYTFLSLRLTTSVLLTTALYALCFVIYRLISHVLERFDQTSVANEDANDRVGILVRFAIGSSLLLISLPFLALIWGAR
ncbi:MAG: DUF3772 domain-containing protein, partial [Pseudomonadota bacterium]